MSAYPAGMPANATISFARGAPSLDIVDVEGLREAAQQAFTDDPAGTVAYGTSVGVWPTRTPRASSASCLAFAVPDDPETIAPAWPIVLPGGAVKPAM